MKEMIPSMKKLKDYIDPTHTHKKSCKCLLTCFVKSISGSLPIVCWIRGNSEAIPCMRSPCPVCSHILREEALPFMLTHPGWGGPALYAHTSWVRSPCPVCSHILGEEPLPYMLTHPRLSQDVHLSPSLSVHLLDQAWSFQKGGTSWAFFEAQALSTLLSPMMWLLHTWNEC